MSDLLERLQAALRDYRIDRQVGEGGMAVVFVARDLKHDRRVAVKVMKPDLGVSAARHRFLREIDVAAKLSHPHILPVYDSGEVDGIHYIIMPFVEGESLRDRLTREGALPLPEVVRITTEIAGGLDYAHGRGLVHRDIKPENVMLQSGYAAVSDFGIARTLDESEHTRFTRTGMAIGTLTYMSPEQAAGEREVDGRSDVYSLGCVLFEMLQGVPPYAGKSAQSVLTAKVMGTLPEFLDDHSVPGTVVDVVKRALAAAPDDRYETPGELALDLQTAITTEAIEAAAIRARRRRLVRALASVGAVVMIGALGTLVAARIGGPSVDRLAVLPFENLRNDTSQAFFLDGMHNALIDEMQQAGLEVIGRRSVIRYRDDDSPIREIASELDVDAIVESFAYYDADSVGLRVRLVDGDSEAGIWNAEFGSRASDIVRLYRDVTGAIAEEIGLVLDPETVLRLASAPPVDPAAYEAYMNGKGHWNRLAPEDLSLAQEYFERALEIAPDYALGHVGMAVLWSGLQQMGLVSPDDAAPRIRASVGSALSQDSTLAEAHRARAGLLTWTDWDWAAGEASFLRAIELNPSYAEARIYYAHLLMHLNRPEEALEQASLAENIEPVSPLIQSLHCIALGLAGRDEDALAKCREVLERDPRQIVALDGVASSLKGLGRLDEYVANEIVRWRELGSTWLADLLERSIDQVGFEATMSEAADSMLARASAGEFIPATDVAIYLADADRPEEALDWIELAYERHAPAMPYLIDWAWPAEVRTDPRFSAVVAQMGLPAR